MLRATLKSLLSRKLRLVLSGMAVVLGVMFVSGAFVLTDTLGRSFDGLFATIYEKVDVQVQEKVPDRDKEPTTLDEETVPGVPADLVGRVSGVSGVAKATGVIAMDGARVIGANGKVVSTLGPPRLGTNWTGEDGLTKLREGRGPQNAGEIAINAALAKAAGKKIGDDVAVLTLQPKRMFKLVGILEYSGGRDSLGGMLEVSFHESVASELMIGKPGLYSSVHVTAAPGVTPVKLRDNLRAALGSQYDVRTGKELQAEVTAGFKEELDFFNKILLGFAAVALFVGIFLILNTFSIIVAQRTRELALMRALGGSRRQMITSVIVEALAIGLLSSVIGLGLGIGVGALLAWVFGNTGGSALELAGIGVPPAAVIGAFTVGMVVTLVAALLPAIRASRIPPVAALQEAATPDRPLTKITVVGSLVGAAGGTLLGLGLAGKLGDSDNTLWGILFGVLISFIGIALLTPAIARPTVAVIGRLFSWSVPGKLGRLNAGRNPRRTAITAAALMVGVALITGVNTILTSVSASLNKVAAQQVHVDLFVSGDNGSGRPSFDPAVLDRAKALPGVAAVTGEYWDGAQISTPSGIERTGISVVTDPSAFVTMFSYKAVEGSIGTLGPDQVLIDDEDARKAGVHAGTTVEIKLPRGAPRTMTVVGVYAKSDTINGWILPTSVVPDLWVPQPQAAYIRVADGASVADVKKQVDALLADSPEVTVTDRTEFIKQMTGELDTVLLMVQILLALAILIAVLGIVNTLALSVLERTRELGLIRAVGLSRAQSMRMVTVEAVVISVFGALLGVVVGTGLGVAVVRVLKDEGITTIALAWQSMGTYLVVGAVIGVVAAVIPAIRAARVNVLAAIAYE